MTRNKRQLWVTLALLICCFLLHQNIDLATAKDPEYPTKPIDFIITMIPGGSTDLSSRALITAASKHLGQTIVPINKGGGGGTIAVMAVKTSKPDGYTIGVISTSTAFVPPFSEGAPYKDLKGFTWIMNFGTYIFPVIVRGDAPWKTWKEFIGWAKENPKAAKIGITGAKTADYKGLVPWQIEKREEVEFSFIPFKGSTAALSAILGGHINVYCCTIDVTTMSYIEEGKLRILAYMGNNKIPGYDRPSMQELYGFRIPDLVAVYGPLGLPDYAVKKLEYAFGKAVRDPEFIKVMEMNQMPVVYMNGTDLMKHVDEWFWKTSKIYEGIKAEEAKEKK